MKKLILLITLTFMSFSGFSQVQPDRQLDRSTLQTAQLRNDDDPVSWTENLNAEDIRMREKGRKASTALQVMQTMKKLETIEEDKVDIKSMEEFILDLYSLPNSELATLTKLTRIENLGNEKQLDAMTKTYFETVEKTFHEPASLVALDKNKIASHNQIVKMSFSSFFDTAIDYAECLVCCPKAEFPDVKWLFWKGEMGKSITPYKAEYTSWYSHKLCGFMIYDFSCNSTFKKARYKGLKGFLLGVIAGTQPRFKDFSPNGTAVHVPMLPAIIVFGLKDIKIPPCQNQALQDKIRQSVIVKCK